MRHTRLSLLCLLVGCDPAAVPTDARTLQDAGARSDAPRDAAGDAPGAVDAGPSGTALAIVYPAAGHTFLESIEIIASAPMASTVSFFVEGEATARCVDNARPFRCLLHLDDVALGPVTLIARADALEARVSLVRAAYDANPCTGTAPFGDAAWGQCVRDWVTMGDDAGWTGVTYQNRDAEHAVLNVTPFPGVTSALSADVGNASLSTDALLNDPNTIVVTNASVAYHPNATDWMSLARHDLASHASLASGLYRSGKMMWFPEHRDVGVTDFFPGYVPFWGVWQGSSYEGWFELSQSVLTLGAFHRDTRAALQTSRSLIAAVQMAERRGLVPSDRAYLGLTAHQTSTVDDPNGRFFLDIAHGMPADWIPPIVNLAVAEEDFTAVYEPTTMTSERYVTTPDAVLRVFTATTAEVGSMVVDVSSTTDTNSRPLSFHWRVVRGDPASVEILLRSDDGARAELRFRRPAEIVESIHGRDTLSQMTVVAVFAHNGRYFSAPAFVSVSDAADVRRWATDAND